MFVGTILIFMVSLFKANFISARMRNSNQYTHQRVMSFLRGDAAKLTEAETKEVRRIIEKELNKLIPSKA